MALIRVRITCRTCWGKGRIWVNTEWQTNSGHYIECPYCYGTGEVVTMGEIVDGTPN